MQTNLPKESVIPLTVYVINGIENNTKNSTFPSRPVKLLLHICETALRELCCLPDQRTDSKKME